MNIFDTSIALMLDKHLRSSFKNNILKDNIKLPSPRLLTLRVVYWDKNKKKILEDFQSSGKDKERNIALTKLRNYAYSCCYVVTVDLI